MKGSLMVGFRSIEGLLELIDSLDDEPKHNYRQEYHGGRAETRIKEEYAAGGIQPNSASPFLVFSSMLYAPGFLLPSFRRCLIDHVRVVLIPCDAVRGSLFFLMHGEV
jgi:hypothetical protein